ncbi:hypothetical protein VOLCADRAFT_106319 [Volvox carteri f. nagariensis]|uniref:Uncharacterized protein n=1 Tax=Volvox carteri f. nagariensis TaxID=3068 RepID=D8U6J7_VOLCA|nr:uncharacterized protein VOLCADRAFT_106319 [Volvox carteri f. nagariensis]EFJ44658.1 hypothetical protein VOLCADRAFT_106319 [Volvox carteri f. nagariensis]|eukprot:XP_002954234.1 hypothetical protein VOLCADRAFT_106319 [Volvox carteri f. nagariensis]
MNIPFTLRDHFPSLNKAVESFIFRNVCATVCIFSNETRLGIVTGKHLAQVCRESYPPQICALLWVLCEISIVALDLTMLLGTAIGLNLLLGWPLLPCILLTSLDALLLLLLVPAQGVKKSEALTVGLLAIVVACFLVDLLVSRPPLRSVVSGLLPRLRRDSVYTAVSLLGANVMPHNFYLHSALVSGQAAKAAAAAGGGQAGGDGIQGHIRTLCLYNFLDIGAALGVALVINVALLLVSAATFHSAGVVVHTLQAAHDLMEQTLSSSIAPAAFGTALLCAGQLSTFTGTIAGQVVLQGFLNIHISTWLRRLITRTAAIIPAAVLQYVYGDRGTYKYVACVPLQPLVRQSRTLRFWEYQSSLWTFLLIAQVVLALQLPVTLVPLIKATSNRQLMGSHASSRLMAAAAWGATGLVFLANLMLFVTQMLPEVSRGRGILDKDGPLDAWIDRVASLAYSDPLRAVGLVGLLVAASAFLALQLWMIVTPLRVDVSSASSSSSLTPASMASLSQDDGCTGLSPTWHDGGACGGSNIGATASSGFGVNSVDGEQRAAAAARGISQWWYGGGGAGLPRSFDGRAGSRWYVFWGSRGGGSRRSAQQLAVQVYGRGKSYISVEPVQQAAGQQGPPWLQPPVQPQCVDSLGGLSGAPDMSASSGTSSSFAVAAAASATASTAVYGTSWVPPRSAIVTVIGSGLRPYDSSTASADLALLHLPWRPRERYHRRLSGCFYSEGDSNGDSSANDVSDAEEDEANEAAGTSIRSRLDIAPVQHLLGSAIEGLQESRDDVSMDIVMRKVRVVDPGGVVPVTEVQERQGPVTGEMSPAVGTMVQANRCSSSSVSGGCTSITITSSATAATAAAADTTANVGSDDSETGGRRERQRLRLPGQTPANSAVTTAAATAAAATGVSCSGGATAYVYTDAELPAAADRTALRFVGEGKVAEPVSSGMTAPPPHHLNTAPKVEARAAAVNVDRGSSGGSGGGGTGGILQRPKHPVARGTRPKFARILEDFWASFYDAHGRPVCRAREAAALLRPPQAHVQQEVRRHECVQRSDRSGTGADGGSGGDRDHVGTCYPASSDPGSSIGAYEANGSAAAAAAAATTPAATAMSVSDVPLCSPLLCSHTDGSHLCMGCSQALFESVRQCLRALEELKEVLETLWGCWPLQLVMPSDNQTFHYHRAILLAARNADFIALQALCAGTYSSHVDQSKLLASTPLLRSQTAVRPLPNPPAGPVVTEPLLPAPAAPSPAGCHDHNTNARSNLGFFQQQHPYPHPHHQQTQNARGLQQQPLMQQPLAQPWSWWAGQGRMESTSISTSCNSVDITDSTLASWSQAEASTRMNSRHHLDADGEGRSARSTSISETITTSVAGWARSGFGAAGPPAAPRLLSSSCLSPRGPPGAMPSEPEPPVPQAPPAARTHPKAPLPLPWQQQPSPPPVSQLVPLGLVAPPPTFSSWCVFGPAVLISFGIWSVFTLAQWCMADSRPAHWGHYASVLNRLQGVLRDARLEVTAMAATASVAEAVTVALEELFTGDVGAAAGGGGDGGRGYTLPASAPASARSTIAPSQLPQHQYHQMFPSGTGTGASTTQPLQVKHQHQHQSQQNLGGRMGVGQRSSTRVGGHPLLQHASVRLHEQPQQLLLQEQQQRRQQLQLAHPLPPTALRLCPKHLDLLRTELLQQLEGMEAYVLGRRGPAETAAGQVAFPKAKEIVASVMRRYRRKLGAGTGVGANSTTAAAAVAAAAAAGAGAGNSLRVTTGGAEVAECCRVHQAPAVSTDVSVARQQNAARLAADAGGVFSQDESSATAGCPFGQPLGRGAGSGWGFDSLFCW